MRIVLPGLAPFFVFMAAMIGQAARADIPAVQHVVIIFQENRTPDNLFHGLQAYLPTADIANSGQTSTGQIVQMTPTVLNTTYDLDHSNHGWLQMWDKGKMDGGDLLHCGPNPGTICPSLPVFQYVDPSLVQPYFFIAENYGFANRMFQSQQGPSYPAHQFILGGTSQPNATSLFFASNNPHPFTQPANGCDAPPGTTVTLIGPKRMHSLTQTCFDHATLTDLIDNPPAGARQGITWRYYTPTEGIIWNAPASIRHMCQPKGVPPTCQGPDWSNGKEVINQLQVLTDIQNNNLASVSWVIPTALASDHARYNDGSGPSWVASIVNAIGNSPYWNNTVILITWDDWGGWYDHVPPPIDPVYGYYQNGFRVPLLVVSPWTPAGYVSQQTHTFGSVLKFTEEVFGLPLIPPGNFVDSRADDLSDFFNFNQPPRPFVTIPAPMGPAHFLNDHRPPQGPDDD